MSRAAAFRRARRMNDEETPTSSTAGIWARHRGNDVDPTDAEPARNLPAEQGGQVWWR